MSKGQRRAREIAMRLRAAEKLRRRAARRKRVASAAAATAAVTAATLTFDGPATSTAPDDDLAFVRFAERLHPKSLTAAGDTLFFEGADEAGGRALWKSDGTPGGAVLVKDINPDPRVAQRLDLFRSVGGLLYFAADDGVHGRELWRSDGTEDGTQLVTDMKSGPGDGDPGRLAVFGGDLILVASDGIHGYQLWRTDGTAAGTEVLVEDFEATLGRFATLVAVGGVLYFSATDDAHGTELWRTDGTADGTELVKDIWPGGSSGWVGGVVELNGDLFFVADDGDHGKELWRSDGTTSGTVLVKDIGTGEYNGYPRSGYLRELTEASGALFFSARGGDAGTELWTSDGTAEGTVMVEDIHPGDDGYPYWDPLSSSPRDLTVVDGLVYLEAEDRDHGRELWKSDGTAEGTVLVKEINRSDKYGRYQFPTSWFTAVGDVLYFAADDGVNGRELWMSDGTAAGTVMVNDLSPGPDSAGPTHLTDIGTELYFNARAAGFRRSTWHVVDSSAERTCHGVVATIQGAGKIIGTRGPDVIVGSRGADVINGRGGDDIICAAGGRDRVLQGTRPDGADVVDGGRGDDLVSYAARTDAVFVSLAPATHRDGGREERDHLVGVEDVNGGAGDDRLVGSAASNRLVGGPGDDALTGNRGRDATLGQGGGDALRLRDGIRGNDVGDGGRGTDTATRDRGDQLRSVP